MPVYKKVNRNFFKEWTPAMTYILGFFAADGYITVNRYGGQFFSIQIVDKQLLEKIRNIIGSTHKISTIRRVKTFSGQTGVYTAYRLQIGSKEMCEDLRRLGMKENKTKSLAVPNVPKKYFADFVRGYFDGDGNVWVGYVHKDRATRLLAIQTVFTSCSAGFLETIQGRLADADIPGGRMRKEKGNYHRLVYSIRGSLKLRDFMYNHRVSISSGLFLERKKAVFERYIRMRL